MSDELWNLFCETGDPMCYLLCKAGEKEGGGGEVKPIPDEFQMNPSVRPMPTAPQL